MKNLFKQAVISILILESKLVIKKYKPRIIGVTGTVGKTSTKDAIYTTLSKSLFVRKSKKSQNSEIGLPLTILDQDNPTVTVSVLSWLKVIIEGLKLILMPHHYTEWLVLEIGADHPGDIRTAVKWVLPDVAVVTKLSKVPVHVEFFQSVEQVVREKSYLVRALKPGGVAVLNADDEDVSKYSELTEGKVVYFGLSDNADISAENYQVTFDAEDRPDGITFDVINRSDNERYPVLLKGTLGNHLMYPILAALATAEAVGENVASAAKNFRTHEPAPGRMRLIEGIEGSTVIDDTYNSSPIALVEALRTLQSLTKVGRKIAVIGDMLELGRYSAEEHKKAGQLAAECAQLLVTVGLRARATAESARLAGLNEVYDFSDSKEAGTFLKDQIKKGDIILVKGSQGVRTERVVAALMAHPEDREKLLVRQDKEWQERDSRRRN